MALKRVQVLTVAILALAVLVADAQQPGGRRGRRGGRFGGFRFFGMNPTMQLVDLQEVQRELQLNEEQRQLLYYLRSDLSDQVRRAIQSVSVQVNRNASQEEINNQLRSQAEPQIRSINEKAEEMVSAILDPSQLERLGEIRLQQEGIRALDRAEFLEKLELTESQIAKIRQLRQVAAQEERGPPPRNIPPEIRDVLSEPQLALWERLKGREFRLSDRSERDGRPRRPAGRPELESPRSSERGDDNRE